MSRKKWIEKWKGKRKIKGYRVKKIDDWLAVILIAGQVGKSRVVTLRCLFLYTKQKHLLIRINIYSQRFRAESVSWPVVLQFKGKKYLSLLLVNKWK